MKNVKTKKHRLRQATITAVAGVAVLFSAGALAAQQPPAAQGPWARALHYVAHNNIVQLGALHFQYYGNSSNLHVQGQGAVPNTGSSQGNATTVALTLGLFLPYTHHHLAIQTGLAPPITFDFKGSNPPSPGVSKTKIGTFKALPPNFTLVYRPFTHTRVRPYIGLGAMWLHTYDTKVTNPTLARAGYKLHLSEPVAFVGQVGADITLVKRLYLNADVRYVGMADVQSRLSNPTGVGTIKSTNHFKAVLYKIGFGYRF